MNLDLLQGSWDAHYHQAIPAGDGIFGYQQDNLSYSNQVMGGS